MCEYKGLVQIIVVLFTKYGHAKVLGKITEFPWKYICIRYSKHQSICWCIMQKLWLIFSVTVKQICQSSFSTRRKLPHCNLNMKDIWCLYFSNIDILLIPTSMRPPNQRHVPLDLVCSIMSLRCEMLLHLLVGFNNFYFSFPRL